MNKANPKYLGFLGFSGLLGLLGLIISPGFYGFFGFFALLALFAVNNKQLSGQETEIRTDSFQVSESPRLVIRNHAGNIKVNAGSGELLSSWYYNSSYIYISRISCAPLDHGSQ